MYAVIRQGSRQYRVSPGDVIQIEKIEAGKGEEVELEDVLLLKSGENLEIGEPRVVGASVKARILRQDRAKKVLVYKFKRRKGQENRYGHRQPFTELKVLSISQNGKELS